MMIKNITLKQAIFFWVILLFSFYTGAAAQTFISQDQKNQVIIDQIKNYYNQINTFSVNFSQVNSAPGSEIKLKGTLYYQAPDKLKSEVIIEGMAQEDKIKTLTIFDGQFLWQQQSLIDEKNINVLKSTIDKNTLQGQELLRQFDFKEQLDYLFSKYNVINFEKETREGKAVNVLNLEIKEDNRNKLELLIKAKGYKSVSDIMPEQILLYADGEQGRCLKIDTFNTKHKLVSSISYTDTKINPGLPKDIFIYVVPEGADVIDMTQTLNNPKDTGQNTVNKIIEENCPGFSLLDLNGNTYEFKNYQDKIIIIIFWATGASLCEKELPLIQELFENYKQDNQVAIFTVSHEPKDDLLNFVFQNKYTFHVLLDAEHKLAQDFRIHSVPSLFVIDKKGKVNKAYFGFYDDIIDKLDADIEELKQIEEF
ncbi:MAG: redoxin domain-containing protein [Candidatus Omnitrophota bacterium]